MHFVDFLREKGYKKENIRSLKNVQPRSLKESNIREKMKGQGRLRNGKVKW